MSRPYSEFDLCQNYAPGSLETTAMVVMSFVGLLRLAEIIEDCCFGCQNESFQRTIVKVGKQKTP